MADISFNTACKELKIAQIAQLNQLFQPLHLAHIYGHGFYGVSRMLLRKNVNNDVSKDSPIPSTAQKCFEWRLSQAIIHNTFFHDDFPRPFKGQSYSVAAKTDVVDSIAAILHDSLVLRKTTSRSPFLERPETIWVT